MPETNLIMKKDLGKVQSLDYISSFDTDLNKFNQVMGIANPKPLSVGAVIKQHRLVVTPPSQGAEIGEGEVIPLTHVKKELVRTVELDFKKYRKSTSMEAIQAHGKSAAISDTDEALLKEVKIGIRNGFFEHIKAATEDAGRIDNGVHLKAKNLQAAIAHGSAAVQKVLDADLTPLVLANPDNIADYLADGKITSNGAVFGVNLLSNFVNATLISFRDVPKGTVYVTAKENLDLFFVNANGEIKEPFGFTTDSTGYIGITHNQQGDRMTYDTVMVHALEYVPDIIDAVVAVDIEEPEEEEEA